MLTLLTLPTLLTLILAVCRNTAPAAPAAYDDPVASLYGRQHNSPALITRSRLYCAPELHCPRERLGDPGRSFVLLAGAAGVDGTAGAVFLRTLILDTVVNKGPTSAG